MILVYGLFGLIAAPFVILAIGVALCLLLLKVILIGVTALVLFIVGLVHAIADQSRHARDLRP